MSTIKHKILVSASTAALACASSAVLAQESTVTVGYEDGTGLTAARTQKHNWNLPSQPLSAALIAWSEQSHYVILSRNARHSGPADYVRYSTFRQSTEVKVCEVKKMTEIAFFIEFTANSAVTFAIGFGFFKWVFGWRISIFRKDNGDAAGGKPRTDQPAS